MGQRLRRLHVLRSALALALIAGFLATPVGIAHPGLPDHDPCDAPTPGQGPAGPRMAPSAGLDAHGHCFTCHWFRSLRSALAAAAIAIPDASAISPFVAVGHCFVAAGESLSAGARAPPA
jgi:hypothetical protein